MKTTKLNITVEKEISEQIKELAEKEKRTVSNLINYILHTYLTKE